MRLWHSANHACHCEEALWADVAISFSFLRFVLMSQEIPTGLAALGMTSVIDDFL